MKKIININLSGRLIPMEDSAYELLKSYLDSLTHYFSREEGGEEIVSDIEDRIAELFQEKLKKGAHCITDQDVDIMVATMGRPEQLEEETSTQPQEKQTAGRESTVQPETPQPRRLSRNENDQLIGGVCSGIANYFNIDPAIVRVLTFLLIWAYGVGLFAYIILWIILPGSQNIPTSLRRRLYRNPENKVIGGVASGIGAYFKIDPVIPRIIFVLPLLGVIFTSIFANGFRIWGFHQVFFPLSVGALPTLIVFYIILWIAVPKAVTPAEKLEMRGEKVDLQSLSNAYKATGDEKKKTDRITGNAAVSDPLPVSNRMSTSKKHNGLGELFGTLVKIVLYFILGTIVIAICGALIGVAGSFLGVAALSSIAFPIQSLILASPIQEVLVWPAILLTFGIPVITIIWLLVKLITGFRPKSRYIGGTLFMLWIIGLICVICLGISIAKDFRTRYSQVEEVSITQPDKNLILKRQPSNIHIDTWNRHVISHSWHSWLGDFIELDDDTINIKAVQLSIRKSTDSNYHVRIVRFSNGRSAREASRYVSLISYGVMQKDSVLYIREDFSLPPGIPFRNQHVLIEIFVPEGKKIDFHDGLQKLQEHRFDHDDWDDDYDTDQREAYRMMPSGLVPVSNKKRSVY